MIFMERDFFGYHRNESKIRMSGWEGGYSVNWVNNNDSTAKIMVYTQIRISFWMSLKYNIL